MQDLFSWTCQEIDEAARNCGAAAKSFASHGPTADITEVKLKAFFGKRKMI